MCIRDSINAEYGHPDNFSLTTNSAANDSVTLREAGVYRIVAKVTASSSANYYACLLINNTEKSRSYASSCGTYYHSYNFYEVQEVSAGAQVRMTQTGANQGPPAVQACFLYIEKIADRLFEDLVR
eukprot:TRINITY_DN4702_c0_g1_i1.p1 TRINITY_DN4702_c0_g1~~TRINITY_DN4702_c0_g1_i1.p1  ORF type:complete len:126 (-),score=25.71 TRINITY_DN4702_c0_g1_i1:123-500(-)